MALADAPGASATSRVCRAYAGGVDGGMRVCRPRGVAAFRPAGTVGRGFHGAGAVVTSSGAAPAGAASPVRGRSRCADGRARRRQFEGGHDDGDPVHADPRRRAGGVAGTGAGRDSARGHRCTEHGGVGRSGTGVRPGRGLGGSSRNQLRWCRPRRVCPSARRRRPLRGGPRLPRARAARSRRRWATGTVASRSHRAGRGMGPLARAGISAGDRRRGGHRQSARGARRCSRCLGRRRGAGASGRPPARPADQPRSRRAPLATSPSWPGAQLRGVPGVRVPAGRVAVGVAERCRRRPRARVLPAG